MNKKIFIMAFAIILLIGVTTAGLFDFLKDKPEETTLEKLNITNDFSISKTTISTKEICDTKEKSLLSFLISYKQPEDCKIYETTDKLSKEIIYKNKDITNSNYFKINSQGLTRFSNE